MRHSDYAVIHSFDQMEKKCGGEKMYLEDFCEVNRAG